MSRTIQILGLVNISLAVMMGGIFFQSPAFAQDVSKEAQRYMIRGQVAMEDAKDISGYRDAVREFKKATQIAPKWGNAWFNLGVAQEKAGDLAGAANSFKKYVALSPNASDKEAIETRIIRLEYRNEQAVENRRKSQSVAADRRRKARLVSSFKGPWRAKLCDSRKGAVRCNAKEYKGRYWNNLTGFTIYFSFPGDGSVVIKHAYSGCPGAVHGFPNGISKSRTRWECWHKDGNRQQMWAITRSNQIFLSIDRPLVESKFNRKRRYFYILYYKP